VTGRYIRLALPPGTASKYVLALHHFRVYDNNGSDITGNSASASGSNNGSPQDAIDGERYSTFWISNHGSGLRYFEVDLGSDKNIGKIEMYDATGGGVYNGVTASNRMRLGQAYIEIKDNNLIQKVKSTAVPYNGGKYFLDFGTSTPTWTK
jgi:hypothetical protein